ncbi:MAG TPA: hypothetical protein VFC99_11880 [Acidimicrobiia bacterium]|nr:hypothetical protein [Acidimicrobiia bacterium]
MGYWFRLRGHPGGLLPHHEFSEDGVLVYPHASGRWARALPWFTIADGFVFATPDHPDGNGAGPWYEIVGSFLYPAEGHPDGPAFEPRYQVRPTPD